MCEYLIGLRCIKCSSELKAIRKYKEERVSGAYLPCLCGKGISAADLAFKVVIECSEISWGDDNKGKAANELEWKEVSGELISHDVYCEDCAESAKKSDWIPDDNEESELVEGSFIEKLYCGACGSESIIPQLKSC